MRNTSIFLCLVVAGVAWARPEEGCDLNLKSIFRTPKDFSKVNLDHFELLERNNFDKDDTEGPSTPEETARDDKVTEDKPSRTVANAQVMLRIGGEDIHNCNRVVLHRPPNQALNYNHQWHQQALPANTNPIHYTSAPPQGSYFYCQPAPLAYHGYYYNPTGTIPNYIPSSYQTVNGKTVPTEFITKPSGTVVEATQSRENAKKENECAENPKPQVIFEQPEVCDNHIEVEAPKPVETHTATARQEYETTAAPPVEASTPECITINTIQTTTAHPNPLPTNIAYVEVNLPETLKTCKDTSRGNAATVVEQSSVSHQQQPVTMSYRPLVGRTPEEQPAVHYTNYWSDSCNRERNPNVPFGHRFSKDVDSLVDFVDNRPPTIYSHVPAESHLYNFQAATPAKTVTTITTTASEAEETKPCQGTVQQTYTTQEQSGPSGETITTVETPGEVHTVQTCTNAVTPPAATYSETVATVETPEETKTVHTEQLIPTAATDSVGWTKQEVTKVETPCGEKQATWTQSESQTGRPVTTWTGVGDTSFAAELVEDEDDPGEAYFTMDPMFEKLSSTLSALNNPDFAAQLVQQYQQQQAAQATQTGAQTVTTTTVDTPCTEKEAITQTPEVYSSGSSTSSDSKVSVGVTNFPGEQPKVYVDGIQKTSGSGYYSNPYNTVVYNQPPVVHTLKHSVMEPTRCVETQRAVPVAQPSQPAVAQTCKHSNPLIPDYSRWVEPAAQQATVVQGFKHSNPLSHTAWVQPITQLQTLRHSNPLIPVTGWTQPQTAVPVAPQTMTSPNQVASIVEHTQKPTVVEQTRIPHNPFLQYFGDYAPVAHPITPAYATATSHRPKVSDPQVYKVVAKYDIIPRGDIQTLNVPNLVPTNQYLQVHKPVVTQKIVCRKEYAPADKLPVVKNEFYVHGWPFWNRLPVQREVPLAPGYATACPPCA